MDNFLQAIREDLLSRRMLPALVLACALLLTALGYLLLAGGGGGAALPPATGSASSGAESPLHVSVAPENTKLAIAETADGGRYQFARYAPSIPDPFEAVPGISRPAPESSAPVSSPPAPSSSSSGSSASSSSPSSTSATSGSPDTGGTTASPGESQAPAGTPTSTTPATPETTPPPTETPSNTIYQVSLLFEKIPPTALEGTVTGPSGTVTGPSGAQAGSKTFSVAHSNVARGYELPSGEEPKLVYAGVLEGAEAAVLKVTGEIFPVGGEYCLPSETQCEALKLPVGAKEQLQYIDEANGKIVTANLEVAQIAVSHGSMAAAKRAHARASSAGVALLGGAGATIPGDLHYAPAAGVLVSAEH